MVEIVGAVVHPDIDLSHVQDGVAAIGQVATHSVVPNVVSWAIGFAQAEKLPSVAMNL